MSEHIGTARRLNKSSIKGVGVDGGIKDIGTVAGGLKTTDLTDRELQEAQLVELKLISMKLDCLSEDNPLFDASDLDNLE